VPVTFDDLRKIAFSLGNNPGNVEESTSYGTPAFKSGRTMFVRLREDGDSLVIGTTFEERDELLAAEPDTYYITDHYLNYPWVLVRMSRVQPDALRDLLARALRLALANERGKPARRTRRRPTSPAS
jgi:hypothetical protein